MAASRILCKRSSVVFLAADLSAVVGAVGTVEKHVVRFSTVSTARFFPSRAFIRECIGLDSRQTVIVNDREAVKRSLPIVDRHGPFLRNIAQRQVEQFGKCLIVGKRAARLRHFS